MHDLKFAPQKTAQIPISRGDGASFSDMIFNLAINFEQNSKDSDLAQSKAARSQDAQTAHGLLTARADFLATRRRPRAARKRARTIRKRSLAAEKEF